MRRSIILNEYSIDEKIKTKIVMSVLDDLIDEYALELQPVLKMKILYYLFRNFIGFGVIDSILYDENVEDISCDGYDIPIFVFHRKYGGMKTNVKMNKKELDSFVMLLCQKSGKYISHANPLVDAALPDGSRLNASYGEEITPRGSSFTIRKFRDEPYTPIDLMNFGGLNSEILAYFWLLVENKMNFMVIGETASGKTTTLNALTMFIPPEAKIISIEDTREIQLGHENWVAEVTRLGIEGSGEITMYDLLRTSLRQRPDYIIVGEIRGVEAQTLFQAMSTGHSSYSTLHAGDMSQLVHRLENKPLEVPRIMIQFLDAVLVQQMWVGKGIRKRRVKEVNEIFGIDPVNKNMLVNPLYKWIPSEDGFIAVSESKKLEKIAEILGEDMSAVIKEKERKKLFLEKMQEKAIGNHRDFSRMISKYYKNPEKAMEELE
jgi:flagellar protein FlaI